MRNFLRRGSTDEKHERLPPHKQYKLGLEYKEGRERAQDLRKAFYWFKKAAEGGDRYAQLQLGLCYLNAEGVGENLELAAEWFLRAAEQGYPRAQFYLGKCYLSGIGVQRDETEALRQFRLGKDQYDKDCRDMLLSCFMSGIGMPKDDEPDAVAWCKEAAEQGSPTHMFELGDRFFCGRGIELNIEEAAKWFQRAANEGHKRAQHLLALCSLTGTGCPWSDTEAWKWLKKASGINEDFFTCEDLWQQIQEQDDGNLLPARTDLGRCYLEGMGVQQNETFGLKLISMAASKGNADAQVELGKYYYYKSRCNNKECDVVDYWDNAMTWLMKAAEQDHWQAYFYLGLCNQQGRMVMRDDKAAQQWLRKATQKMESLEAACKLVHVDWKQQKMLRNWRDILKSCAVHADSGDVLMQEWLGFCYTTGVLGDVLPRNNREAVKWFRKAAEKGGVDGQYRFGVCLLEGQGIRRSVEEAKIWFQHAANAGDRDARQELESLTNDKETDAADTATTAVFADPTRSRHEQAAVAVTSALRNRGVGERLCSDMVVDPVLNISDRTFLSTGTSTGGPFRTSLSRGSSMRDSDGGEDCRDEQDHQTLELAQRIKGDRSSLMPSPARGGVKHISSFMEPTEPDETLYAEMVVEPVLDLSDRSFLNDASNQAGVEGDGSSSSPFSGTREGAKQLTTSVDHAVTDKTLHAAIVVEPVLDVNDRSFLSDPFALRNKDLVRGTNQDGSDRHEGVVHCIPPSSSSNRSPFQFRSREEPIVYIPPDIEESGNETGNILEQLRDFQSVMDRVRQASAVDFAAVLEIDRGSFLAPEERQVLCRLRQEYFQKDSFEMAKQRLLCSDFSCQYFSFFLQVMCEMFVSARASQGEYVKLKPRYEFALNCIVKVVEGAIKTAVPFACILTSLLGSTITEISKIRTLQMASRVSAMALTLTEYEHICENAALILAFRRSTDAAPSPKIHERSQMVRKQVFAPKDIDAKVSLQVTADVKRILEAMEAGRLTRELNDPNKKKLICKMVAIALKEDIDLTVQVPRDKTTDAVKSGTPKLRFPEKDFGPTSPGCAGVKNCQAQAVPNQAGPLQGGDVNNIDIFNSAESGSVSLSLSPSPSSTSDSAANSVGAYDKSMDNYSANNEHDVAGSTLPSPHSAACYGGVSVLSSRSVSPQRAQDSPRPKGQEGRASEDFCVYTTYDGYNCGAVHNDSSPPKIRTAKAMTPVPREVVSMCAGASPREHVCEYGYGCGDRRAFSRSSSNAQGNACEDSDTTAELSKLHAKVEGLEETIKQLMLESKRRKEEDQGGGGDGPMVLISKEESERGDSSKQKITTGQLYRLVVTVQGRMETLEQEFAGIPNYQQAGEEKEKQQERRRQEELRISRMRHELHLPI
ncbi:hypothetical protein CBR_g39721 [Chara braunii]|uniref:Uncharacterized protein n=1 Tax=Chara braunii TaxID=69332 RepID=A0A388LS47_CHABU|nr:hypothetical protein CBR_g39721 [Chara braunii]|eukprot:GBG85156.1 hypothetical protein CBR_g39721 [Chara braunii]